MWTELFLDNADFLSEEIGTIIRSLSEYKEAIDARDAARLESLLAEGDKISADARVVRASDFWRARGARERRIGRL